MATNVIEYHFKILLQEISYFYSTDTWKGEHLLIQPFEANCGQKNDIG